MDSKKLLFLTVGALFECLYYIFITDRFSRAEAKKAKYNCDNCRNYQCNYYYCKKKRCVDKIGD